ncbi:hypothetical protein MKW94_021243 [Papaver nudicaule]|uniref:At1g61320/AtMIF1 LRR domain-containing protein n=1 Tax=Papaver nudicaule TaxID=74823 RepID=A0AA41S9U4_PAPNU|nr:hypothetical protein [Papaver nudicaule]
MLLTDNIMLQIWDGIVSMYKNFLSVKYAELTAVDLLEDSLYELVSKCLCLEELRLIRCNFSSSSLELNSPESNLKCLPLAMSLSTFQLCCNSSIKSHHVTPLSTMQKVLLKQESNSIIMKKNEHMLFFNLLKDLHNVKVLTLFFRYLEVLDTNAGRSLLPLLCNLKHLDITLLLAENELPSLMCLLRNSPSLETLSMNLHLDRYNRAKDIYDEDEVTIPEQPLLPSDSVMHLTKIDITNFQGLKAEMEFVKIMLQSSLCLKEMVICISSRYEYLKKSFGKMFYEVLQKKRDAAVENVLACPCVSPDARILIK